MARIWCVGMLLALTAAAGLGRWSQTAEAILMAGSQAVRLGVTLTGSMMLWGGLMEMLHDTAVLGWVSGGVRRLLKPLVRRELSEESWAAMGMNLTANLFGLGNAATPMGIRAAKLLAEQGENGRIICTPLCRKRVSRSISPAFSRSSPAKQKRRLSAWSWTKCSLSAA